MKLLKKYFSKESNENFPSDFERFHIEIIKKIKPYTMTSYERLYALIEAVKYIVKNNINGDFVECGVWRGGSMMAIAQTLLELGVRDRKLFLFDTFEGMTEPGKEDMNLTNQSAKDLLKEQEKNKKDSHVWAFSTLDEVKANMKKIDYPEELIHYKIGDVKDTIPVSKFKEIALLRLDTDWYESTSIELNYLFPSLVQQGVLIVDDYGCWKGAKQAVDEYFATLPISYYLHRIDETGRLITK